MSNLDELRAEALQSHVNLLQKHTSQWIQTLSLSEEGLEKVVELLERKHEAEINQSYANCLKLGIPMWVFFKKSK